MNAKNVRIKDIAQLAGVSVGTVDRVLHNRGRVSDDALKKVLTVLEQIDYKPNMIARALGSNKTYTLAGLMPDPKQDPYWALSRSGISLAEAEWLRYGVTVKLYFFDLYNKASFNTIAQEVTASNPDGVLVAPIFYHETLPFFEQLKAAGIPYVLFNTNIPESDSLSFIGQNLFQSGKLGAELMYLSQTADEGLITVLHINEDLDNSIHLAEKEKGFREYFSETKKKKYTIETLNLYGPGQPDFEKQLRSFISNPHLTGIFVSTSKGASLVASYVQQAGRNDIRIIGYDMLEENIRYMQAGVIDFLINQNPKRQAFLGINHLAGNLILNKPAPESELLPLEIISRQNLDSYLGSRIH